MHVTELMTSTTVICRSLL